MWIVVGATTATAWAIDWAPNEVTITGLDYAFGGPRVLPPGPTVIAFENRGEVLHEMILVRLKEGVTWGEGPCSRLHDPRGETTPAPTAAPPGRLNPEGDPALNTGNVGDADGDAVNLIASVGTVVNNNDGTWFWSLDTTDGPAESQTVTIDADDGNGGTARTSFTLTVNNVAPTLTAVTLPTDPVAIADQPVVASGSVHGSGRCRRDVRLHGRLRRLERPREWNHLLRDDMHGA